MCDRLQDLIDYCIIKELKSHFQLQYSDEMFPTMPYYTDAGTVLRKNGYKLVVQNEGFVLDREGITVGTFTLGAFSACFLNQWIADSGIEGVSGFPVGFSVVSAKTRQGSLTRSSDRMIERSKQSQMTPAQADCLAAELFVSNEVVKTGVAGLFICRSAEVLSKNDFLDEDDDGSFTVRIGGDEGKPFYHAIDMRKKKVAPAQIPSMWVKAIANEGLSYNFEAGILYVANTVGASLGLPPAPAHLGVANLTLTLDDWDDTTKTSETVRPPPPVNTAGPCHRPATFTKVDDVMETSEATVAIRLVEQFMDMPSKTTYDVLIESVEAHNTFIHLNKLQAYKMGSNKHAQTSAIRNEFLGVERRATFEEYAQELQKIASPKNASGFLVLLMRLKGLLRLEGESMYFNMQM